jgi:hypothetical protein
MQVLSSRVCNLSRPSAQDINAVATAAAPAAAAAAAAAAQLVSLWVLSYCSAGSSQFIQPLQLAAPQ